MQEIVKLEIKTKTEFDVFDIVKIKEYSNDKHIIIGKLLCHSQKNTFSKKQDHIDFIYSFYEIKYIVINLKFFNKVTAKEIRENLITNRKELFDLIFNILFISKIFEEKLSKKCVSRINLILKNIPTLETASVFLKQVIRNNSEVFLGMFLEKNDMIKSRHLLLEKN